MDSDDSVSVGTDELIDEECVTDDLSSFLDDTFERFVAHSSVRVIAASVVFSLSYVLLQWLICTALGIRVATDLVVSGAMIHKLRSSRTGFRRWRSHPSILLSC